MIWNKYSGWLNNNTYTNFSTYIRRSAQTFDLWHQIYYSPLIETLIMPNFEAFFLVSIALMQICIATSYNVVVFGAKAWWEDRLNVRLHQCLGRGLQLKQPVDSHRSSGNIPCEFDIIQRTVQEWNAAPNIGNNCSSK